MTDTDMLYMASLEKRNEELGIRIAELEGKHHNEFGNIYDNPELIGGTENDT